MLCALLTLLPIFDHKSPIAFPIRESYHVQRVTVCRSDEKEKHKEKEKKSILWSLLKKPFSVAQSVFSMSLYLQSMSTSLESVRVELTLDSLLYISLLVFSSILSVYK